ncbi:MAG: hypoxanthine phosphoribosyltransferase, partial [Bacillota bacterium]|nr:hypoxanthine phosphoribosyltransferase [Bacillota bacterium]
ATHSYGGASTSSGEVRILKDLSARIHGKHVLVVEDIVDTGRTLQFLKAMLETRGPASLKLCTLLDKPSRRAVEIEADYVGFSVPDEFVVGYGLDYDDAWRHLPYIGVLRPEDYAK